MILLSYQFGCRLWGSFITSGFSLCIRTRSRRICPTAQAALEPSPLPYLSLCKSTRIQQLLRTLSKQPSHKLISSHSLWVPQPAQSWFSAKCWWLPLCMFPPMWGQGYLQILIIRSANLLLSKFLPPECWAWGWWRSSARYRTTTGRTGILSCHQ